jgi:hypothetical protein
MDDFSIRKRPERHLGRRNGLGQGQSRLYTLTADLANDLLSCSPTGQGDLGPISHRLPPIRTQQLDDGV